MNIDQVKNLIVNMPSEQKTTVANTAPVNVTVNPYNTRSDGFLIKNILGASAGMSMKPIVFDGAAPTVPYITDEYGIHNGPDVSKLAGNVGASMLVQTATNALGISILYGAVSLYKQSTGVNNGQQDMKGMGANIVTDMLRGATVATGGTVGGTLSSLAFKAMGVSGGAMGTIAACVGGLVGSAVAGGLFEKTNIREGMLKKFGSTKI